MTPEALVEAARRYIGVPFEHCGRSLHGVDCVGLILAAARDCGLMDLEVRGYSRHVDPAVLRGYLERFCDRVGGALDPADVLLFKVMGQAQHVGLYTEEGKFIHAYESAGKVVEHSLDSKWRQRLIAVYCFRNW